MCRRRILSLDQSLSSCGWALWDEGEDQIQSGAWPLADGIRHRASGFTQLFRNMAALHDEKPISIIAHETPLKMPIDKREKLVALYGLVATIELFCDARGIQCTSIGIEDWRKTFYSPEERKGRPYWKRMAIERSRQLGFDPRINDEAEAIAILDHQLHVMQITPSWRLQNPFLEGLK